MGEEIPHAEIKEISPPYRRNEAFCKVTSWEELGTHWSQHGLSTPGLGDVQTHPVLHILSQLLGLTENSFGKSFPCKTNMMKICDNKEELCLFSQFQYCSPWQVM